MPKREGIRWEELEREVRRVRVPVPVPVPVRRKELEREVLRPIEDIPAWVPLWTPARETPRRWRAK